MGHLCASLGALLLLLSSMCSTSLAQSSVKKTFGDLIDDIARLTWAETNCSGRASDGVRELRLYLRKHANAEFEEALIRNLTDTRQVIDEARKVVSEKEAIWSTCIGVDLMYGPRGSLPGLWQDNRAPPAKVGGTSSQRTRTYLPRFGAFVRALAYIDHWKGHCKGVLSDLASEFTKAFINGASETELKKLYEEENPLPDWMQGDVKWHCEELIRKYGSEQTGWPPLWYGIRSDTKVK